MSAVSEHENPLPTLPGVPTSILSFPPSVQGYWPQVSHQAGAVRLFNHGRCLALRVSPPGAGWTEKCVPVQACTCGQGSLAWFGAATYCSKVYRYEKVTLTRACRDKSRCPIPCWEM